jgi:cytochrome c553
LATGGDKPREAAPESAGGKAGDAMKRLVDAFLSRLRLGNGRLGNAKKSGPRATAGSTLPAMAVAAGVAGLVFSSAYIGGASAQSRVTVDNGPELQTLYATPEDIAQGKLLAETTCAGCHGANGISETATVPHLAGQRPAYLFLELKAYQSDARGDSAMNSQVKFLSDDALLKVSAYFASLDPPSAEAVKAGSGIVDPVQAGKTAAVACAGCHGGNRRQRNPGHAEPCRAGSKIHRCGDEGVQGRATRQRPDEVDARNRYRAGHGQHCSLLWLAETCAKSGRCGG